MITTVEPGSTFVGVLLRHGAASAVLGVPASELAGRREELGLVWDGVAEKMSARLVDVTTPEMAAALLEREIIGRLAEAPKSDPVVGELVRRLRPWRARPGGQLRQVASLSLIVD